MNCKVFLKASKGYAFVKKSYKQQKTNVFCCLTKKQSFFVPFFLPFLGAFFLPLKNSAAAQQKRYLKLKANLVSLESQEQLLRGYAQKNKVITMNYSLDSFHRSNQDTCLVHKPAVFEGQWVESGDLLADCSASLGGELSLGQNILIAYMPWEGYNFEDAILISERLVYDDLYTSIHIEKYEMEIRETKLGIEQITREIPEIQEKELENLDSSGVAKLGSWVQEGDILVGKITPINKKGQSPYQKLLYTILEKQFLPIRDSSLRAPKGIKAKVIGIQIFKNENNPIKTITKVKKKSNQVSKKLESFTNSKNLANKERSKKINVLDKTSFKSYKSNAKRLICINEERLEAFKEPLNNTFLNSLELKTLNSNLKDFSLKKSKLFFNSKGLMAEPFKMSAFKKGDKRSETVCLKAEPLVAFFKEPLKKSSGAAQNFNLQNVKLFKTVSLIKNSFVYAMNKIKPSKDNLGFVLTKPQLHKGYKNQTQTNLAKIYFIKKLQGYALARSKKTFSAAAKQKHNHNSVNFSEEATFALKPTSGSLVKSSIISKTSKIKLLSWGTKKNMRSRELYFQRKIKKKVLNRCAISSIHIFLAEKRKVQIGDKMAGRHGNKGIISQILPREDMPYLPDGTPLDMILNPLGVPSRMNVGQIYECLLGFAGKYLGENYKVFPFDEIYGPEASRSFVYSKLYEARVKTGFDWLYNPNNPGKIRLYDGRTGESFDQDITVGDSYILRLVHMVDDKIHARSTGPYSLVTQQPLRGRSKQGGQRLGEMEVWALEGYGAAFTLLEMLTIKSDDMTGRMTLWSNLILNKDISIGTPESFKVLVCELQALCLDIGLFRSNPANKVSLNEIDSLMNLP
jgi:DNA-directed RNA polymerase beta subunit